MLVGIATAVFTVAKPSVVFFILTGAAGTALSSSKTYILPAVVLEQATSTLPFVPKSLTLVQVPPLEVLNNIPPAVP